MATALAVRDITAAAIDTVRGNNADSWEIGFQDPGAEEDYGDIHDTADSFVHGSAAIADTLLTLVITGDSETVAILDMDFITVTYVNAAGTTVGFVIWLPALSGNDTLYVDTDGNTWYNEALTSPAGGVKTFGDGIGVAERYFSATDWLTDAISVADAIAAELNLAVRFTDTINIIGTITDYLDERTAYFKDRISVLDGFSADSPGDFTEDTQTDHSWVEV